MQARGHTLRLGLPVEQQRGRHHHQRGHVQPPGFFLHQQVRQGLRCFAQAHVVGQDAGKLLFAQVLQPGQALQLVRAQRDLQTCRCGHGGGHTAPQPPGQYMQTFFALQLPRAVGPGAGGQRGVAFVQTLAQGFEPEGFPRGELERAVLTVFSPWLGQQVEHGHNDGFEWRSGCVDAAATRCTQRDQLFIVNCGHCIGPQPARLAFEQGGQHRGQVEQLTVHLHAQRQQPGALPPRQAQTGAT